MKNNFKVMAASAILGVVGLAQTASAGTVVYASDTVGSVMLADRLGMSPNLVISAGIGPQYSVYDTAPAFTLAAYSRRTPRDIWAYHQRGYGWDKCAVYAGVPVATYDSLYASHQFEPDYVWADEYYTRYGIPREDLLGYRRSGYSWRQIGQAAIVSQDTQEPVLVVLGRARTTRVWYPPHYRYRPAPYYVPPRFNPVVVLPARPAYASWWNRPTSGLSIFYSSSGGFGLSLNFASYRRPIYNYWSPLPIVRGYPYRPIAIARPPRVFRTPVWYNRNGGGTHVNININNSTHRTTIINNWNRARNLSVRERSVALRLPASQVRAHNDAIGTRLAINKAAAVKMGAKDNGPGNPANFTQSQKLKDRAKRLADAKKAGVNAGTAKTRAERAAAAKRANTKAHNTTADKSKVTKTREQNQKRLEKAKAIEKKQSANTHRKAPVSNKVERTRAANQRRLDNAKRVEKKQPQTHAERAQKIRKNKPTREFPGVKENQRKQKKHNGN